MNLAEEKRRLVAESEALRREISRECSTVGQTVGRIGTGLRSAGAVGGALLLAWRTLRGGKEPPVQESSPVSKWLGLGLQAASLFGPLAALFRR